MKNILNARVSGMKAVAPRYTYSFGFSDDARGAGMEVRNGQIVDKTRRKSFFYQKHGIVKL
jgi:hypothetical protein